MLQIKTSPRMANNKMQVVRERTKDNIFLLCDIRGEQTQRALLKTISMLHPRKKLIAYTKEEIDVMPDSIEQYAEGELYNIPLSDTIYGYDKKQMKVDMLSLIDKLVKYPNTYQMYFNGENFVIERK